MITNKIILEKFIQEIIKTELNQEGSISSNRASNNSIALYEIKGSTWGDEFILININNLDEISEEIINMSKKDFDSSNISTIIPWIIGSVNIIGSIGIKKNTDCNAYYVKYVFAEKGYGPLLYDIAMESATSEGSGLMADREYVKPAAINVWKYYYFNRNDVEKIFLPDDCKFASDTKDENEEKILNSKYFISNPQNISGLKGNFGEFITFMRIAFRKAAPYGKIEQATKNLKKAIIEKAHRSFEGKYDFP